MSNFISAKQVIRSALEDYGHTADRYFNPALRWVKEAVESIGLVPAYSVMLYTQDLDSACTTIDKPDNYISARSISLCSGEITTDVAYGGAAPSKIFDPDGCCTFYNRRRKFMDTRAIAMGESPTHFFFMDGSPNDWERIEIEYNGHPEDENGYVLVSTYANRAVQSYIHYKLTSIDRRKDRTKVTQQEVNDSYALWLRLKADAYGQMQTTPVAKMKEMARSRFFKRMTTPDVRRYNGPVSVGSSTATTEGVTTTSSNLVYGDDYSDEYE